MNKLFIRSVAILCIAILILTIRDLKHEFNKKTDNNIVSSNKLMQDVNRDNLLSYFDSENAVIYLGTIDDKHNAIIQILSDLSISYNIDNFVYYDINKEKPILSLRTQTTFNVEREPTSFYSNVLNKLGDFASDYDVFNNRDEAIRTDYKIVVDPTVFFIRNGKIIFSYFIKDINLSDKELDNIRNIYIQGFELIKLKA